MNLVEYRSTIKNPVRPRTLTFLVKDDEVLLVLKKRGFGKGNYLGVGGKVEEDKDKKHSREDPLAVAKNAAIREVFEEIGVRISLEDLAFMGILRFYFPLIEDESWNQAVYIFITHRWQGTPVAKRDGNGQVEVEPEWVDKAKIPFDRMWDDAHLWLPQILEGKKLNGEFIFDENLKVSDHSLNADKK